MVSSNDSSKRGQVSILSEKSDENEDDNETVVGIDYTDDDCDQNEDDYDSVPVNNNALDNGQPEAELDANNLRLKLEFINIV